MVKRAILVVMLAGNHLSRRLNKIQYKTGGKCNGCGNCCKVIAFRTTEQQLKSKYSLKLTLRWFSWFYGFNLLAIDHDRKALFFSCRHRQPDERCDNYFWRPPLCRNFPFADLETKPVFLPRCGYQAW